MPTPLSFTVVEMPTPPPSGTPRYKYDVFVSYSDVDEEWCINHLVEPLKRAEFKVTHRQDFTGLYKVTAIDEAVRESRHTLLVLTPAWVGDQWSKFEAIMAQTEMQGRLIPLIVEPCAPPPRIEALEPLDYRNPGQREAKWKQLLALLSPYTREGSGAATDSAIQGLVALDEWMRVDPVRGAVASYEESFRGVASQIDDVSRFKKLHDDFHVAEATFRVVLVELKRLRRVAQTEDQIEEIGFDPDLAEAVQALINDLDQPFEFVILNGIPDHQVTWKDKIKRTCQALTKAAFESDGRRVARAAEQVQYLIGSALPSINEQIVRLARPLSLRRVAEGLQAAHDRLAARRWSSEYSTELLGRFSRGIESLCRLDDTLTTLLENHDWLQSIDVTLEQFEGCYNPTPHEIADAWEDIQGLMEHLHPVAAPDWVAPLQQRARRLEAALRPPPTEPGAVRAVQYEFNQLRAGVKKGFNRVDIDLLDLCGKLRTFGTALVDTIRGMQNAKFN